MRFHGALELKQTPLNSLKIYNYCIPQRTLGQRPADVYAMDERHLVDGFIAVQQRKNGAALRIAIEGELARLLERIARRKRGLKLRSTALILDDDDLAIGRGAKGCFPNA